MLLRGQNIVGYQQYPDDVVEKFVELEPGWEKGRAEAYAKGLASCDEDAMTYILFPTVAEPFLKRKMEVRGV